jgi:hypothetical protein
MPKFKTKYQKRKVVFLTLLVNFRYATDLCTSVVT